jgi:protein-S-isoprenylcysteine O-methyltransferase Ste14
VPVSINTLIQGIWIIVGIIWLIGSLTSKSTKRQEPSLSRAFHLMLLIIASLLLFTSVLRIGPLGLRVVPESAATDYIGLALTVAGCVLAVWARVFLGRNWSALVTVKKDHTLIRNGPYSFVRHPIYSGLLLAMLGTAVAEGEIRGFVAIAMALFAWWGKSLVEEQFMTEQFGAEYTEYQHRVKRLIPFVM